MGLTLEFLSGDTDGLIAAFRDFDLKALYSPDVCLYRADFSLHLLPQDLDILSESIGEISGLQPVALRPFLFRIMDEAKGGVLGIEKDWRDYVAQSSDASVNEIVERWAGKMRLKYQNAGLQITQSMVEAVRCLLFLCKMARAEERNILHIWYP